MLQVAEITKEPGWMLQRLVIADCKGQGTELQQKVSMWDTVWVPDGHQPALWGKGGHRQRGH